MVNNWEVKFYKEKIKKKNFLSLEKYLYIHPVEEGFGRKPKRDSWTVASAAKLIIDIQHGTQTSIHLHQVNASLESHNQNPFHCLSHHHFRWQRIEYSLLTLTLNMPSAIVCESLQIYCFNCTRPHPIILHTPNTIWHTTQLHTWTLTNQLPALFHNYPLLGHNQNFCTLTPSVSWKFHSHNFRKLAQRPRSRQVQSLHTTLAHPYDTNYSH